MTNNLQGVQLGWTMPKAEEATQNFGTAVPSGTYIVKVAAVWLRPEPTWVSTPNGPKKGFFDYNQKKLDYTLVFAPYKSLITGNVQDIKGQEVAPLSPNVIYRQINPYSYGKSQSGEYSYMRQILAAGLRQNIDELVPPEVLIVDKINQKVVEDPKVLKAYADEFKAVSEGQIQEAECKLINQAYCHIPNLNFIKNQYVTAKVVYEQKGNNDGRNKITGFDACPIDFKPDKSINDKFETEFIGAEEKILEKRAKSEAKFSGMTATNSQTIGGQDKTPLSQKANCDTVEPAPINY